MKNVLKSLYFSLIILATPLYCPRGTTKNNPLVPAAAIAGTGLIGYGLYKAGSPAAEVGKEVGKSSLKTLENAIGVNATKALSTGWDITKQASSGAWNLSKNAVSTPYSFVKEYPKLSALAAFIGGAAYSGAFGRFINAQQMYNWRWNSLKDYANAKPGHFSVSFSLIDPDMNTHYEITAHFAGNENPKIELTTSASSYALIRYFTKKNDAGLVYDLESNFNTKHENSSEPAVQDLIETILDTYFKDKKTAFMDIQVGIQLKGNRLKFNYRDLTPIHLEINNQVNAQQALNIFDRSHETSVKNTRPWYDTAKILYLTALKDQTSNHQFNMLSDIDEKTLQFLNTIAKSRSYGLIAYPEKKGMLASMASMTTFTNGILSGATPLVGNTIQELRNNFIELAHKQCNMHEDSFKFAMEGEITYTIKQAFEPEHLTDSQVIYNFKNKTCDVSMHAIKKLTKAAHKIKPATTISSLEKALSQLDLHNDNLRDNMPLMTSLNDFIETAQLQKNISEPTDMLIKKACALLFDCYVEPVLYDTTFDGYNAGYIRSKEIEPQQNTDEIDSAAIDEINDDLADLSANQNNENPEAEQRARDREEANKILRELNIDSDAQAA